MITRDQTQSYTLKTIPLGIKFNYLRTTHMKIDQRFVNRCEYERSCSWTVGHENGDAQGDIFVVRWIDGKVKYGSYVDDQI